MANIGDIIHIRYDGNYACRAAIVTATHEEGKLDITVFDRTNLNGAVRSYIRKGNYHYPQDCPHGRTERA